MGKILIEAQSKAGNIMQLTVEQRLQTLERENVVLHDTIKMLHKLLKDQKELISDYILRRVTSLTDKPKGGDARPEDAVYTFVCRKRFDKIEKDIKRILKLIESSRFGLRVG